MTDKVIHTSNGNGEERTSLITGKPLRPVLFYESMTEIRDPSGNGKIRVWRREEELPEYPDMEILSVFKCIPGGALIPEIVQALGSLDRVTAIEYTDANGLGGISYYEW